MMLPKISGKVLVVGDVMEDVIVLPEGEMVPGSDVRAKIRSLPGGSGANQAVWLGSLGVPVRFLARVGDKDVMAFGAGFKAKGVEAILVGDKTLPTGRLVTLVGADGERSFFTDRAANLALSVADMPDDLLDDIGLVHLSGYTFFEPGPRAVAMQLMELAYKADIPVSIDPASTGFLKEMGAAQFRGWTQGAQFLFPNRGEAVFLSGLEDAVDGLHRLGESYGNVVMKLGAEGAMALTSDGVIARADAVEVKAVDTTGAGDAFFAGFVAAWLEGKTLEACLEQANATGAKAATQLGGQPV